MSEAPAPVRYRSYSQLSTYQTCPEQYRLKYVERVPEEPAVWSVGGTAFHQVAEWYLQGELGADPGDDRVVNAWEIAWNLARDEILRRNPEADPTMQTWRAANRGAETASWWRTKGIELVLDFIHWKRTAGAGLQVLTIEDEKYLEARLQIELAGVPVVAIPDWLAVDEHGQLVIVDYKTGKPPRESKQLGVYRAAVQAALGFDAQWGLYYMARDARGLAVDLTKYDPQAIGQEFALMDEMVRDASFTPTPGDYCKFCPYKRRHCRAWNPETA